MDWSQPIDLYCERTDAAFWSEPANAISNAAFLIADMLSDNTARAASFGLYSHLAFDFPVACKTGTSSDYRDNWAVGYTPEFTVEGILIGGPYWPFSHFAT